MIVNPPNGRNQYYTPEGLNLNPHLKWGLLTLKRQLKEKQNELYSQTIVFIDEIRTHPEKIDNIGIQNDIKKTYSLIKIYGEEEVIRKLNNIFLLFEKRWRCLELFYNTEEAERRRVKYKYENDDFHESMFEQQEEHDYKVLVGPIEGLEDLYDSLIKELRVGQ